MARKPRIHFPGAVYHVILRGNAGQPVFFDDTDRSHFYLLLQEGVERYGFRLHAFCCMTNHIHLALQVGAIPLSRIMQNLSLRYTAWVNRRQQRTGHLFQGRYKSILLDADCYLLELVRYIHLNPVRAGIAEHPEEYPWSGHAAYLGKASLPWLTTDWVLSLFSPNTDAARMKYREFVAEGMEESRQSEFHNGTFQGRILGDDRFSEEVLRKVHERERRQTSLAEVVEAVCRVCGVTETELKAAGKVRTCSEARAIAALLVREAPHLSLTDLGRRLNREVSALSQSARRIAELAKGNVHLAARIDELRAELL